MIALYIAECRRFARSALGLGSLHAVALLLIDRSFPGLRDDGEMAVVMGFVYGAVGVAFGFYQSASYARANHWIALLHRPLAPVRIMAGVIGAGATMAFATVLLPLLVFTATLTLQVGRVVDARHWLLAVGGALIALIGYGVGSYLALAPRRYGWTALVATSVVIVTSLATGAAALFFQLLIIVVLAVLLAGAFRPDRTLPPSNPARLAVTAAVVSLSLYLLIAGGTGVAYQLGLAAIGGDPETGEPRAGGVVEASRAEGAALIAAGLAEAKGDQVDAMRRALQGARVTRLPVALRSLPSSRALTNVGAIGFSGGRERTEWTFSHDSDAFEGLRVSDRHPVAPLRPADGFKAPPLILDDGRMIAGDTLYRFDPSSGKIAREFKVSPGETIAARPVFLAPMAAVLSDRALYLADREALAGEGRTASMIAVPLPGLIGDLQRLDVARLRNGFIVSFVFGRDAITGPSDAWQRVVAAGPDGTVRALAQRALRLDHSDVLRFRSYWLSPLQRAASSAVARFGSDTAWIPPQAPVRVPGGVWIAAGLLSFASAAATALLSARHRLVLTEAAAWTLAALAIGIPMLVAFCLLRAPLRVGSRTVELP